MMDYNLLLEWMGECGSGSWHHFRDAHAWLLTKAGQDAGEVPPVRTLDHLSRLGHVESARVESRWAVSPTVVTIVPGASVHAVVVGARTQPLQHALRDAVAASRNLDLIVRSQEEGPDVLYISCNDERALIQLTGRLGAVYEHSVSERISLLLPPLDNLLQAAAAPPPRSGYGVSRWHPDSNRFPLVSETEQPGLYRYEVYGTHQYRFTADGHDYADVDLHTGRYAELRRLGRQVLRYIPETINGQLIVSVQADLPVLHARSAILCSGLLPRFDRQERSLTYYNVPPPIATRIVESLGQRLLGFEEGGGLN